MLQRPDRTALKVFAFVSASVVGLQFLNLYSVSTQPDRRLYSMFDVTITPSSVGLCSAEKLEPYFDLTELKAQTDENIAFHQHGGNLKSIQEFLDNAMDPSLEKLGLRFVPKVDQTESELRGVEFLRKYYEKNSSPRQGYGESLPGKWDDEKSPVLHEKRWFDVIEPRKKRMKWDASLGPMGPTCKSVLQLGDQNGDGYKYMCVPEADGETTEQAECHVISVGGNDNWKFETAIVDQLGCSTYTFDCTLPGGKPKRMPDNPKMHFFDACVAGKTHEDSFGRRFLTYADMMKEAGIKQAPDYFKIDVEGFEYDIFTQMIKESPSILPRQIQVELHWATRMTSLPWMPRTRSAAEIALLGSTMFNGGGYMPVHLDFNAHCTSCMEVLYFRTGGASCSEVGLSSIGHVPHRSVSLH